MLYLLQEHINPEYRVSIIKEPIKEEPVKEEPVKEEPIKQAYVKVASHDVLNVRSGPNSEHSSCWEIKIE